MSQINEEIMKAMQEAGYESLRPLQEKAMAYITEGKQIALQASTGAGKTLAFLLPLITMTDSTENTTQALVISPTRELALQTHETAEKLTVYCGVHSICVIGGMDIQKQENALRHRPHLIIATPGRLLDLMSQNKIDLTHLKTVILDEADQIVSTGQSEEAKQILEGVRCPVSVFSATLSDKVRSFLKGPYTDIVLDKKELNHRITSYYYETEDKIKASVYLLKHMPVTSAVIFVNHKDTAAQLSKTLQKENILSAPFSSIYDERRRISVIRQFKEGTIRVLCATDSAARGLDLPEVSHIIHFDLPTDTETFIHRSGRSGHNEDTGISITLISAKDQNDRLAQTILLKDKPFIPDDTFSADLSHPITKKEEQTANVTKLLLRAGRKDKIRPGDVVGALCTIFENKDIGKIEIQDNYTTVTILLPEDQVLFLKDLKIKGKKRKVEKSRR